MQWLLRFTEFVSTKRGLAGALNSTNPGSDALFAYFKQQMEPVVAALVDAAREAGEIRSDIDVQDVLYGVTLLCQPAPGVQFDYNQRLVGLFIDGMRAGYSGGAKNSSAIPSGSRKLSPDP